MDIRKDDALWAPHRRPAYPVDAPALTRHLCFRLSERDSPYMAPNLSTPDQKPSEGAPERPKTETADESEYDKRQRRLLKRLNAFLNALQPSDVKDRPRFRLPGEKSPAANTVPYTDTLFVRFEIAGACRLGIRVDVHNEYIAITYLADSIDLHGPDRSIGKKVKDILDKLADGDVGRKEAQECTDYFYDEFWGALERCLKHSLSKVPDKDGLSDDKIFADFRGAAFCSPELTRPLRRRMADPRDFPPQYSGTCDDKSIDRDVMRFIEHRPVFFGNVLQLGTRLPGESEPVSSSNVVFSGIMNGAGIYGSSLRARAAEQATSLNYIIIYNGRSDAQLGRFMRRIHVLGELRTAALMDIRDLRKANRVIRSLAFKVEAVDFENLSDRHVQALYAEYAKAASAYCQGGVTYRVGRSRYYAQAYRERLQDLRIVRAEGWQPYDEFMRRNLFMEFDYISQVGERFDQVARRIDRLGAIVQVNALRSNTRKLGEFQFEANFFAHVVGAAAFTYYLGTVIGHVSEALQPWYQPLGLSLSQHIGTVLDFSLACGLYFLARYLFRNVARSRDHRSLRGANPQNMPNT